MELESRRSDLCEAASHDSSRAAEMPLVGLSTVVSGRAFPAAPRSSGFPMAIRAVDGGRSVGLMCSPVRCARKVGVLTAVLSSSVSNVFIGTFPPISTLNASHFVVPALPTLAEASVEADLDSSFCISYPSSSWYCHSQHGFPRRCHAPQSDGISDPVVPPCSRLLHGAPGTKAPSAVVGDVDPGKLCGCK